MKILILLLALLSLALGSGCGDKKKTSDGRATPARRGPTMQASMKAPVTGVPGPVRRASPRAATPRPAGSAQLFFKWSKDVITLHKTTRRDRKRKAWARVLPVLDKALALQPDNLDIRYHRAWMRALTGNATGALADLEVLLHAHYPKYAHKVAKDKDFASLHRPPHKAQLDAALERARKAHVVAWRHSLLFLGGSKRAYRLGSRVAGTLEVYGYHPTTGNYVGVTYVGRANVLGFIVEDGKALVYVTASRLRTAAEPVAYADLTGHALDLGTGRVVKSFPAEKPAKAPKPRRAAISSDAGAPPPIPGFGTANLNLRGNGYYELTFLRDGPGGKRLADKTHVFSVYGGKVTIGAMEELEHTGPDDDDDDREKRIEELSIHPCGATTRRVKARPVREEIGTLAPNKKVSCPGLIWRADTGHALYQPYRYCKKPPHEVRGLYLLRKGGKLVALTPDHEARDLRWHARETRALLQIGHRLGFVDTVKGTFTLLAPRAAFLQAYAPRLGPCK